MAIEKGISSYHKDVLTNNALQNNPDIALQKKPEAPTLQVGVTHHPNYHLLLTIGITRRKPCGERNEFTRCIAVAKIMFRKKPGSGSLSESVSKLYLSDFFQIIEMHRTRYRTRFRPRGILQSERFYGKRYNGPDLRERFIIYAL